MAATLTRQEVEKVSLLGRLRLTDAELDVMTEQLGQIVGYMALLAELDTERVEPMAHAVEIANVFRAAGATIRQSWCGPCFGQGEDALSPGQRAITTFNRNWQNRMGLGGEGYLASPAVVAASALAGYMAPPSELGIEWNPSVFGV